MATGPRPPIVMDEYCIAFGAHLRALRQKAGLSQEALAHAASIHVTYLSGIERGNRNPSLRNIRRLALALRVPVKELFEFEDLPHEGRQTTP